ncbi:MAG: DnaJ domain-containing protein [Candidatus Limnocylindrales bacterium]
MTEETDLYSVLEVDPSADLASIRAAYRRQARRYHPDANGDGTPESASRMRLINLAWATLRDPGQRAAYDLARAGQAGRPAATRGQRSSPSTNGTAPSSAAYAARPGGPEASAGPPPGRAEGSVLTFGRYAGWSLGEIARRDADYLEWLERSPAGRGHRDEIDALLRRVGRRTGAPDPLSGPGRFRR